MDRRPGLAARSAAAPAATARASGFRLRASGFRLRASGSFLVFGPFFDVERQAYESHCTGNRHLPDVDRRVRVALLGIQVKDDAPHVANEVGLLADEPARVW